MFCALVACVFDLLSVVDLFKFVFTDGRLVVGLCDLLLACVVCGNGLLFCFVYCLCCFVRLLCVCIVSRFGIGYRGLTVRLVCCCWIIVCVFDCCGTVCFVDYIALLCGCFLFCVFCCFICCRRLLCDCVIGCVCLVCFVLLFVICLLLV